MTLGSQGSLDIQVTGEAGVPASGVSAVVVNVTVTGTSGSGYLTVFPQGVSRPLASNLNFVAGQTIANLVEVALGSTGQITAYNSYGNTDVVADVAGYVLTPGSGTGNDGLFHPVVPARALDTRDGTGGSAGPLGTGTTTDLQVTGFGGVPASGVAAVIMNVTVTAPTSSSFLTVYPTGAGRPLASNLNFVANQTIPNRVIVQVGDSGKVTFFNQQGSVHVIADINGYFTDGSATADGSTFSGLTPTRILDTRDGTGGYSYPLAQQATATLQVAGRGGVPAMSGSNAPTAVVMNVTATGPTSSGYLTVWPDDYGRPLASDLNFAPRQTIPNLVIAQVAADGNVAIFNQLGCTDIVADVVGWYSGPLPAPGSSSPPPAVLCTPPPPPPPCHTSAPSNPYGYDFCTGNTITAPPSDICNYISCIQNFWNGRGYIEQCQDTMFSKSGGIQGSCSSHGGNKQPLYSH